MNNMTQRQTLEQKRAKSAWDQVESVDENSRSKYATLARKLPSMIQINGLGATLAFLLAKGKSKSDDGHTLIFRHLSDWLKSQEIVDRSSANVMLFIQHTDMDNYRRATAEAIEYGIWLRRFVEANDWKGSDD